MSQVLEDFAEPLLERTEACFEDIREALLRAATLWNLASLELPASASLHHDAVRDLASYFDLPETDAGILVEHGTVQGSGRGRPSRLYTSAELLELTGSNPLRA